jgi:hypothetical protein
MAPMSVISSCICVPWRTLAPAQMQFDTFCSMVRAGDPVEAVLTRIGVARHVRSFVTYTMDLANASTTEEVLAAFLRS